MSVNIFTQRTQLQSPYHCFPISACLSQIPQLLYTVHHPTKSTSPPLLPNMFCCDVGDECADEQGARKKLRTLSVDTSPTPSSPLSSPPSSSDGDSDSDTETVDYDYDTTIICDMRRSKPQPPPLETLSADGTIYYCPVLPNAKDFAEAVHEETHDAGSYVFISLGKDPEGLWKGDVNWDEDTGEYREDARNEEVREMVFAAFREKVKETEEVKLYGVFPRFWGWVAFKAGDAGQRAKNSVRVVEEAGVWVNYISFAEWYGSWMVGRVRADDSEGRIGLSISMKIGRSGGLATLHDYVKANFIVFHPVVDPFTASTHWRRRVGAITLRSSNSAVMISG